MRAGGAIYTAAWTNYHGGYRPASVTISGCTLSDNAAPGGGHVTDHGGAIYVASGTTVHVGGTTFGRNNPENAFGPYIDDGGNHGLP
jgi:hypothetical protein